MIHCWNGNEEAKNIHRWEAEHNFPFSCKQPYILRCHKKGKHSQVEESVSYILAVLRLLKIANAHAHDTHEGKRQPLHFFFIRLIKASCEVWAEVIIQLAAFLLVTHNLMVCPKLTADVRCDVLIAGRMWRRKQRSYGGGDCGPGRVHLRRRLDGERAQQWGALAAQWDLGSVPRTHRAAHSCLSI